MEHNQHTISTISHTYYVQQTSKWLSVQACYKWHQYTLKHKNCTKSSWGLCSEWSKRCERFVKYMKLLAQYAVLSNHLGERGLGDPGLQAGRWFFLAYNMTCSRSKGKITDFVIKIMYSIRIVEKWFPQRKWSIQKDTPNQILGCTLQTHTLHMALSPTKQSLCVSSKKHL